MDPRSAPLITNFESGVKLDSNLPVLPIVNFLIREPSKASKISYSPFTVLVSI